MEQLKITEEDRERTELYCKGCDNPKAIGLIVCWKCFKYRPDVTPLKYYDGTFKQWINHIKGGVK